MNTPQTIFPFTNEGRLGGFQAFEIMNKYYKNVRADFSVDVNCQLIWINMKGHD